MKHLFLKGAVKRAYLTAFSVIFLSFFSIKNGQSQTILSAGDIAFTGYNSDGNDSFSFILLTDITNNTVIKFTDKGWNGTAFRTGEGDITYTNNTGSTILAETQITIRGTSSGSAVLSGSATTAGSVTITSNLGPSSGGDQIFAYQGTLGSPTFIAGIHMNLEASGYPAGGVSLTTTTGDWDGGSTPATDESRISGTGLTNGTNCVWLYDASASNWEVDNARMKATAITGTIAQIRSACNNRTNWDFDQGSQFNPCAPVVAATVTTTTWNGTTWSNGTPTSTIDAVIASNTTPGAFTCEDLTINSGFDLTLNNGVTATVAGDITNSGNGTAGTGTIRFTKSGTTTLAGTAFTHAGVIEVATGTTLATASKLTLSNNASLMHGTNTSNGGGAVTGSITFEKTMGSTTDGWRSFSLPVDELIDNFETGLNTRCSNSSPAERHNVYYWDGSLRGGSTNNVATGWTVANNSTDDENKGYSIYLSNNSSNFFNFSSTVSVTGSPNDGTKTFNLDYTFDPEGDSSTNTQRGWNLIPNYFPSNLSVVNLINSSSFGPTYKAVHIWDQAAGQLKAMNQSGLTNYNTSGGSIYSNTRQIPPFMAFWVKANTTSQSVQLNNSMRTGRSDSLPANNFFKGDIDVFRIEVKDQENNFDQYSVCFVEGASKDFDPELDLYKFKSFSTEVPTLYSMHGQGDMLSLNALPIKESYSLPVYFESYKNGREYTVSPITENYSNYYNVELVDNKTGVKTDLLNKDYKFIYDEAYKNARLTLNFKRKTSTSVEELYNQERSYAYTNANGINVVYKNNNATAVAGVEIYNMLGQKLFSQENISADNTVNYTPSGSSTNNVYIIRVTSNSKTNTIKVLY